MRAAIGKMAPDAPDPRDPELSPAARSARVALYLLLLAAAAAALLIPPGTAPGAGPGRRPELLLAPVLLGAFAIGFTAYRFTPGPGRPLPRREGLRAGGPARARAACSSSRDRSSAGRPPAPPRRWT